MNTIREAFALIYTFLKACTNLVNEMFNWSEELVVESTIARGELYKDRMKRLEDLGIDPDSVQNKKTVDED